MKINLRWQALLAVMGFGLIFALLSYQVQTTSLCTTRVPTAGGTFIEGIVGSPQHLNPLLSDAYPVDRDLVSLIFDGLTRYDESGMPVPALAESWTISDDGLRIQFSLRQDVTWHDGEPFTADDVLFTYQLLQDATFTGSPALKPLWQSVTINKLDAYRIEIELPEPYAPFLDATTRGILPVHLLGGITAVSLPTSTFNHNPIGTGPFMIQANSNWGQDHRLQLTPNPAYWREGVQIPTLEFRFYPDETALTDAFTAGDIHGVNKVTPSILPSIASQPGTRLFTAAETHYTTLLFNLTDSAALQDSAVRQALAYALDREKLVDDGINGQGLPMEGPYLPTNWAYNPNLLTSYNQQIITATTLLDNAGWLLPEGATVRQQEETALNLQLLTLNEKPLNILAESITAQWANVGVAVNVTMAASTDELRTALSAQDFDVALVDITASGDPDLYDFWSQEAIVRGQNYGGWNNRRASEALENGRKLWTYEERRPYYDTFLRQYNNDIPAITLYQHVYTYALSQDINNAEIGLITSPRDRYQTFANWFLLYQDVTISCPSEAN